MNNSSLGNSSVVVRGTRPTSWAPYVVGALILVLWWIGVVWCFSNGQNGIAFVLGPAAGLFTLFYLFALAGTGFAIGRAQATADSAGIRTWRFDYRWDEVLAFDFVEAAVVYGSVNTQRTSASKMKGTSLVVTLRKVDGNGRPLQIGYTLHAHHTKNFEEFKAAAQRFCPTLEIRSEILVDDYVVDPQSRAKLTQQFMVEGKLVVRDRRGREKIVVDSENISDGEATVALSRVGAMVAVTDVFTTKTVWPGGVSSKSSERTHRLVIVGNDLRPDGTTWSTQLLYPKDYAPSLELFIVSMRKIAPQIPISDRRTTG